MPEASTRLQSEPYQYSGERVTNGLPEYDTPFGERVAGLVGPGLANTLKGKEDVWKEETVGFFLPRSRRCRHAEIGVEVLGKRDAVLPGLDIQPPSDPWKKLPQLRSCLQGREVQLTLHRRSALGALGTLKNMSI